jgi:DNA invertase Pin-like site-specific DNA recombinase
MKAVLYSRFSPRRNEDDCESIQTQEHYMREYCGKKGIDIVAEFSDRALSGEDESRPGLWSAVDSLKKGYALIVYRLDRLARNVYLSNIVERAIEKAGASVISIFGEGTENDSDENKLIRQILQSFAEYQRKVMNARTRSAMIRHQNTGRRMSHILPYGWQPDPNNPARMLPNEAELAVIKKVIAYKGKGFTLSEIARKLTEEAIRPRPKTRIFKGAPVTVASSWTPQKIQTILRRV